MLTAHEIDYWVARYRGPNPAAAVAYAQDQAKAYVDRNAPTMLPSIRGGIYRTYFRMMLEGDPGERTLLRCSIDCLLELGRAVHANSRT